MIAPLLALAASQDILAGPVESWVKASKTQRREIVSQITRDCKLPAKALRLNPKGELVIQPPPNVEYKALECMMGRIRAEVGFDKIGFVGNEQIEEKKR